MKKLIRMMSLMLLLAILLSSCSRFPRIEPIEIGAINVYSDYCRVAKFDFNQGQMKAITTSEKKEIEYCHKFIGMSPKGWENLINYLKDIYAWKEKYYKSGFKWIFKPSSDLKEFIRKTRDE